jgi:hypothetical protein
MKSFILCLSLSLSFGSLNEEEISFGSFDLKSSADEDLFSEHIISGILALVDEQSDNNDQPSLAEEITQVETELVSNRVDIEKIKLQQYILKHVSEIFTSLHAYRSPPGSPRIPFESSESFEEIQSRLYKLLRSLETAKTIADAKSAASRFNECLKSSASQVHPQIIWNASKGFILSRSRNASEQVRLASELLAQETIARDLQRKRAQLVFKRAQELRQITDI